MSNIAKQANRRVHRFRKVKRFVRSVVEILTFVPPARSAGKGELIYNTKGICENTYETIGQKIKGHRLRWLCHVYMMDTEAPPPRKCLFSRLDGSRRRPSMRLFDKFVSANDVEEEANQLTGTDGEDS